MFEQKKLSCNKKEKNHRQRRSTKMSFWSAFSTRSLNFLFCFLCISCILIVIVCLNDIYKTHKMRNETEASMRAKMKDEAITFMSEYNKFMTWDLVNQVHECKDVKKAYEIMHESKHILCDDVVNDVEDAYMFCVLMSGLCGFFLSTTILFVFNLLAEFNLFACNDKEKPKAKTN